MFKPPNSNILKIFPYTGCLEPRLCHFSLKKIENLKFFSMIQNGPIRKVNMFKPPNSNILKDFPMYWMSTAEISRFLKKKDHFSLTENDSMRIVIMKA